MLLVTCCSQNRETENFYLPETLVRLGIPWLNIQSTQPIPSFSEVGFKKFFDSHM